MKNFVLLLILFGAALFGYSIRSNLVKKIDHMDNEETAKLIKQVDEEVKKQIAADIEKRARESTKEALLTMNYKTANGEKCTKNCQDTFEGFEAAKSQNFNESSNCIGKTEAYTNGCQVYVDKYYELYEFNKEANMAAEVAKEAAKDMVR